MTVYDIIFAKRNGLKLSPEDIRFLITGYTDGNIPDYQMAAFLMAAFIRGMDDEETAALTDAMTRSGRIMDLSDIPGPTVDKHSTGGVGDGTSLVIAPLVACAGLAVPMMSGRCLGHTGGTLDKLESIPGFRVCLDEEAFRRQLKDIGVAMIGQTAEIAPADRKIYALRDVTATVDCVPLIAASIMSKKLAEGADALVLDVKTGSGAFMRTLDDARDLARALVAIGKNNGRKMQAVITGMDQPLGNAVGNAIEVRQAVDIMRGKGPADITDLVLELSGRMLVLAGKERDVPSARRRLEKLLADGSALTKFRRIVEAQGGDPAVTENPERVLPPAREREDVAAAASGYVAAIDTRAVGRAGIAIGAGRCTKDDRIDPGAGFLIHKKIGDRVTAGEALASVLHNGAPRAADAKSMISAAYAITPTPPPAPRLIIEEIN